GPKWARIVPGLLQAQPLATLGIGLAASWDDRVPSSTGISRKLARLRSNASLLRWLLLPPLAGRVAPSLEQGTAGPEKRENSRVGRTLDDVGRLPAAHGRLRVLCSVHERVSLRVFRQVDRRTSRAGRDYLPEHRSGLGLEGFS